MHNVLNCCELWESLNYLEGSECLAKFCCLPRLGKNRFSLIYGNNTWLCNYNTNKSWNLQTLVETKKVGSKNFERKNLEAKMTKGEKKWSICRKVGMLKTKAYERKNLPHPRPHPHTHTDPHTRTHTLSAKSLTSKNTKQIRFRTNSWWFDAQPSQFRLELKWFSIFDTEPF